MRCERCKNKVLQKAGDLTRLRTHGPVVFQDGVCKSRCYWCKSEIVLPLQIAKGTEIPEERYVLRK